MKTLSEAAVPLHGLQISFWQQDLQHVREAGRILLLVSPRGHLEDLQVQAWRMLQLALPRFWPCEWRRFAPLDRHRICAIRAGAGGLPTSTFLGTVIYTHSEVSGCLTELAQGSVSLAFLSLKRPEPPVSRGVPLGFL